MTTLMHGDPGAERVLRLKATPYEEMPESYKRAIGIAAKNLADDVDRLAFNELMAFVAGKSTA